MALDVGAIRQALAAQIKARVAREVNVYDGYLPAVPQAPCVLVAPDSEHIDYHQSFSRTGTATVKWRIGVFTPTGPDTDGQRILDEFESAGTGKANSILDALYFDDKLGGLVEQLVVRGCTHIGRVVWAAPDAQVPVDAAEFLVDTYPRRA